MFAVRLSHRPILAAFLGLFSSLAALPAIADAPFNTCVAQLQSQARQDGISAKVVDELLGKVSHNPTVIHLDRKQPEFTQTFAGYLNARVTDSKVAVGRELFAEHRSLLERVARQYGVPAKYLLAFWGMETDYGRYFGKMPIVDSLTTLACNQRRSAFFSKEVIAALKMVDEGAVKPDDFKGSWAGAIGNFQFLPSVFLRYAVDYDGDGKRDVWHSLPDALASAANFLKGLGWNADTRWGREVLLPKGFPYQDAGINQPRSLTDWHKLGVETAFGKPLPLDDQVQASLVIPAGYRGPAFLVYHNFHVIMDWNHSEYYALSVGYLADRIAGAAPLQQAPPVNLPRLTREQVQNLQSELTAKGFDAGQPDGILGSATRSAIRDYQQHHGMIADGYPGEEVLASLGVGDQTAASH